MFFVGDGLCLRLALVALELLAQQVFLCAEADGSRFRWLEELLSVGGALVGWGDELVRVGLSRRGLRCALDAR